MSSVFDGMNLVEIKGMPLTAEATGVVLSYLMRDCWRPGIIYHPDQVKIALRQERYVREVFLRCPWWKPWKRLKLAGALKRATAVADFNCRLHRLLWPKKQVGGEAR